MAGGSSRRPPSCRSSLSWKKGDAAARTLLWAGKIRPPTWTATSQNFPSSRRRLRESSSAAACWGKEICTRPPSAAILPATSLRGRVCHAGRGAPGCPMGHPVAQLNVLLTHGCSRPSWVPHCPKNCSAAPQGVLLPTWVPGCPLRCLAAPSGCLVAHGVPCCPMNVLLTHGVLQGPMGAQLPHGLSCCPMGCPVAQ